MVIFLTLHSAHFQGRTFLSWQLHKKFGNVFSLQNCWTNLVVLNGYKTVKEALVHRSEDFADRPYFPVYEHLGYGNKSEGKALGNGHSPLALAQGGLSRWWVDGKIFLSTVPPSHVPLVKLFVCLPPFGCDKISFDEKGAPLSGCSTAPGVSTHLFSGVRTLSVVQLSCQRWSW